MSEVDISVLEAYPTPQELFDLTTLACQLYRNPPEQLDVERHVCQIVDSVDRRLYVARAADSIVGQLVCNTIIEPGIRYGFLGGVVVDESFRGRGIASGLVQAAVAREELDGIGRIDLTSSNPAAQSVYIALGFRPVATTVMRRAGGS